MSTIIQNGENSLTRNRRPKNPQNERAARFCAWLETLGLSPSLVASRINETPQTLNHWQARGAPPAKVWRLAEVFPPLRPAYLLGQDDRMFLDAPNSPGHREGNCLQTRGKKFPIQPMHIPVRTWDGLIHGEEIEEMSTLFLMQPLGAETFALPVLGSAMEPVYQEGDLIIVDPNIPPEHGSDVVVILPQNPPKPILRRLERSNEGSYLVALNPQFPDRIQAWPAGAQHAGTVIMLQRSMRRA